MTTEAVAPHYFLPSERLPISRFFKWWKKDYSTIALKFASGAVVGGAGAIARANNDNLRGCSS